jgi:DNA modification methylase
MTAPRNTILVGDAATRLRDLPSSCVDCEVTSPPYFHLRNYAPSRSLYVCIAAPSVFAAKAPRAHASPE